MEHVMSSPTQGYGSCWLLPLEKHVLVLGKKEGKIAWPLTSFFPQEGPQVLKRMNGSSIRAALPWHHHRIRTFCRCHSYGHRCRLHSHWQSHAISGVAAQGSWLVGVLKLATHLQFFISLPQNLLFICCQLAD